MKKLFLSIACMLFSVAALCAPSAYDALCKFAHDKHLQIGFDPAKKRIVTIGVTSFHCDNLDSKLFDKQRMLYYNIAAMMAKADIIKNISSNISAKEEYNAAYGTEASKGIEGRENFSSYIKVLSSLPLRGYVIINHAESYDEVNKQYEIAVIALWSAKSEAYALGKKQPKARPDKKPGSVREWLSQSMSKSIGARTFVDKDGKIWFLGIAAYPVNNNRAIAKSFASMEAQAIVNFSLYADVITRDQAAQIMQSREYSSGKTDTAVLEALVKNIAQSFKGVNSKARLLAEKEVAHPISGRKYLAVAYGYAPSPVEVKRIAEAKSLESVKQIADKKNTKDKESDCSVVSYGTGPDRSQAIKNALLEAIKMVNGAAMEANSEMQKKYVSVSAKLNKQEVNAAAQAESFKQNVKEQTSGLIQGYAVISFKKLDNGRYEAQLRVQVFKFDAENPRGNNKATVAVLPVACEEENEVYNTGKDERTSASEIALKLFAQLEKQLAAKNAFIIIDKANLGKVLKEQALTIKMVKSKMANIQEMAKIGNLLSADYLVLAKLMDYSYSSKAKFDPRVGRVKKNVKLSMALEIKVLSAADSRVILSEELKVKLNRQQIKKLVNDNKNLRDAIIKEAAKIFADKFCVLKGKK